MAVLRPSPTAILRYEGTRLRSGASWGNLVMYTHVKNANEGIYPRLREAIIFGEYPPGSPLGEVELSLRFEVSRTPIREALKRLAGEGLVSNRGRGLAVNTFSPPDVREVYDLRALLEGHAASLAAKHARRDQLDELHRLNDGYLSIVETTPSPSKGAHQAEHAKALMQQNSLLHSLILDCAGNQRLHFLVSRVMVLPLVFRSFYWYNAHELRTSAQAHALLINAIADGDADRARSAMTEHIYHGRDFVLGHLETDAVG